MSKRPAISFLRTALIGAGLLLFAGPAVQAAIGLPCGCYFNLDCPDPDRQYCDWQSNCSRHCLPAATPPAKKGASPQCDGDPEGDGPGPCFDREPQPPVGDDGDGSACKKADPAETTHYKMQDGVCKEDKRECPFAPPSDLSEGFQNWTDAFQQAGEGGGGEPASNEVDLAERAIPTPGCRANVRDAALNMATLCLGDKFQQPGGANENGFVDDLTGPQNECARQLIAACGQGLAAAVLQPGTGAVTAHLATLSGPCQSYANGLPTHCLFPHPSEHGHPFPFTDGPDCIAEQLEAAARALTTGGSDVPTLSTPGLVVLGLILASSALLLLYRRRVARRASAG